MEGCLEGPDLHGGERYSLHVAVLSLTEPEWPRLLLQVLIRGEGECCGKSCGEEIFENMFEEGGEGEIKNIDVRWTGIEEQKQEPRL